jgi:hypothetical protein
MPTVIRPAPQLCSLQPLLQRCPANRKHGPITPKGAQPGTQLPPSRRVCRNCQEAAGSAEEGRLLHDPAQQEGGMEAQYHE